MRCSRATGVPRATLSDTGTEKTLRRTADDPGNTRKGSLKCQMHCVSVEWRSDGQRRSCSKYDGGQPGPVVRSPITDLRHCRSTNPGSPTAASLDSGDPAMKQCRVVWNLTGSVADFATQQKLTADHFVVACTDGAWSDLCGSETSGGSSRSLLPVDCRA